MKFFDLIFHIYIAKLRRMSDAEYEALDLFPDFEKEDTDAD